MPPKAGLMAVVIALSSVAAAHASGRLPILPTTESFTSHAACLTALQGILGADRNQAVSKRRDANGDTTEVQLTTTGIKVIDRTKARYDVTIWFHYGQFRADLDGVEISHSFEHRVRSCDGSLLHTSGDKGFTLSTFEPARADDKPKPNPGASR